MCATTSSTGCSTGVRSGFVHLPLLPVQAARRPGQLPSMGLQLMTDGVRLALQTALTVATDLRISGGSLG